MPTVDMLEVMTFNHPGFCNNGMYTIQRDDLLMIVKNPAGFPIDMLRVAKASDGKTYIYDQQTEDSWDEPGWIKLHVGNGGRGIRMCERYVSKFPHVVSEVSSPLYRIRDGKSDYKIYDAGPTTYVWNEPRMINWGGDVKNVLTYPVDYYWSGGRKNREQLWYSPGWSRIKWNHMTLKNGGLYSVDTLSDQPKVNNRLMSLKDWQKTYPKLQAFGFDLPFMAQ